MTIFSPATTTSASTGTVIFLPRPQPQPFSYFKPESSQSLPSINPHLPRLRPRSHLNARLRRPHASLSPQQPPQYDPPPESDSARSKGITATSSRIQDRVQIFLAVLFWLSLFFWASA